MPHPSTVSTSPTLSIAALPRAVTKISSTTPCICLPLPNSVVTEPREPDHLPNIGQNSNTQAPFHDLSSRLGISPSDGVDQGHGKRQGDPAQAPGAGRVVPGLVYG